MSNKLTLIIPAFSYGPPLERTWASCQHFCDDLVIISTAFWEQDLQAMRKLTPKVVVLDWNYTAKNGFGEMMNRGTGDAKNDWCLLLGVGETFLKPHFPWPDIVTASNRDTVHYCDHEGDKHLWGRIWNKNGGPRWGGLIHESLVGGVMGPTSFQMQDTPKEPRQDPYEDTVLKHIKNCLYHLQYNRLRDNPKLLGGTDPGWLGFVEGSKEANLKFLSDHSDLVGCMMSGDLQGFLSAARVRYDSENPPVGVNHNPLGQPFSEGAMPLEPAAV